MAYPHRDRFKEQRKKVFKGHTAAGTYMYIYMQSCIHVVARLSPTRLYSISVYTQYIHSLSTRCVVTLVHCTHFTSPLFHCLFPSISRPSRLFDLSFISLPSLFSSSSRLRLPNELLPQRPHAHVRYGTRPVAIVFCMYTNTHTTAACSHSHTLSQTLTHSHSLTLTHSGDGEGQLFFWDWKTTKMFRKVKF